MGADHETPPLELTFDSWQDDGQEAVDWREQAVCASTDPDVFFPEKGGSTREAKKVCAGCPVRMDCLLFAIENNERFGVWGGLSEKERRAYAREHGITMRSPDYDSDEGEDEPAVDELEIDEYAEDVDRDLYEHLTEDED